MTEQESSAPEEKRDSLSEFCATLPEKVDPYRLREKTRLLSSGVFIHEDLFDEAITLYQHWLQEKTESAKHNIEKLTRKLFGSEHPPLYYVIDGKHCLSGHLIACSSAELRKTKIPYYQGSLHDAANYLHPKDPALASLPDVKAEFNTQGLSLTLMCGKYQYAVSLECLEQFSKLARHSFRTKKMYPEIERSLRDCLRVLAQLVKKASFVRPRNQLLIPQRFRNDRYAGFLRRGSLIFVVRDDHLAAVYDLVGKNRAYLLSREAAELADQRNQRRIGCVEVFSRGRSFAALRTREGTFQLTFDALQMFLTDAPHTRTLQKKFRGHYTLRDALKILGDVFQESAWVDEIKVPREFKEHKFDTRNYRLAGDWAFVISGKDLVSACIVRRSVLIQKPLKRGGKSRGGAPKERLKSPDKNSV